LRASTQVTEGREAGGRRGGGSVKVLKVDTAPRIGTAQPGVKRKTARRRWILFRRILASKDLRTPARSLFNR